MRDEGVVKFRCDWRPGDPPRGEAVEDLVRWRNRLYKAGLLGAYENGVGFGNISLRDPVGHGFVISGTQTGAMPVLGAGYFTHVLKYDVDLNEVTCAGPVRASSESLTHAMIYEMDPAIRAVVHGHHRALWQALKNRVPTTAEAISYGTPEMAAEVSRLFRDSDLNEKKLLAMAGHEDGVLAFGESLEAACGILLEALRAEGLNNENTP